MDALIAAVTNLEDAVDAYTAAAYTERNAHGYEADALSIVVVATATQVALDMADADVNGTALVSIIPPHLRDAAAEAEIAALHGSAKLVTEARCSRCAGTGQFITYVENGVPKGPGGPCYRCNGKGVQTVADHRRNFGYDRWGVKVYA